MKKLVLACALFFFAFSAFAQRTFVSVNGLDTNPCSTSQPCRTIQQALNAVAAGGDVIILDTGGFGTGLSINKSCNILAPDGVFGVITGAVTIAAAGTDIVRIKGLNVVGPGTGSGIGVDIGMCKRTELTRMNISHVQTGVKISQDVKARLQGLSITDTSIGIWCIGTNTPAGPGQTSPPLKVYVEYTEVVGAVMGVKLDAGSFIMQNANTISYTSQDTYLIDSKVPNCSSISLNFNTNSQSVFNTFTGQPVPGNPGAGNQEDLRNGMNNLGNCNN
jgi:hypothetical protein